ncbi:MAG: NAD(P)H-hydrate epimerase, partial [Sphaerochaetaceae bacterium]
MEKVLSVSSIARIDEETVSQYGVPQSVLIENAASDFIKSLCLSKDSLIQIICGKGNNGADGFAIGRRLSN